MSDATDLLRLHGRSFVKVSRRYLGLLGDGVITPSQFVVLVAIADKTVSWRRLWYEFTNADLEAATNLSHQGVRNAVRSLENADLLVRKLIGRSYAYALVPPGATAADLLSMGVDNPTQETIGKGQLSWGEGSTQLGVRGAFSYSVFKKNQEGPAARVDKGLQGKADPACAKCSGQGWLVLLADDGWTESVAACPCTQRHVQS